MKKYLVDLTDDERAMWQALVQRGKAQARKVTHARILLQAVRGATDLEVVTALGVGLATVERMRRRFVEEVLAALNERPRPDARPRLSARAEARLVAEACSAAPEGREHWMMRLLAGRVVELGLAASCSHETMRRALKKEDQAVAEEAVVHPFGQRRVRRLHRRCARLLRRALRRFTPDGQRRLEEQAARRRDAHPHPG